MSLRSLLDVPAPAKLNLFLHVVGRRADGYHLIQSVFALIDWCDTLHFERRADGLLRRHDLSAPLPEDDLCLRAARALQLASGTTDGADISIDKQLPAGAGMGGGSSDAASTLLALNRLWGLNRSRAWLAQIALRLGADVPFFIGGNHAWVEGIGERLTPLRLPPHWLAVVKPPQSISTEAIFTSPLLVPNCEADIVVGLLARTGVDEVSGSFFNGHGRNDLQPAAEAHCPEVALAALWLQERFGNSRMTGSGSAVFATAGKIEMDGLRTNLPTGPVMPGDLPVGWMGRMCRSLDVHPLKDWTND